jgi:hypothetical protein
MRAGRLRELGAQAAADVGAERALPAVDAFEHGAALRRTRDSSAELVRVLELFEESNGVVDAVDAELEGVDVP